MLIILILIPTITVALQLVLHKFFYKVTKKYWFTFLISFVFLSYFLVFRYIPDFIQLVNADIENLKYQDQYTYSFYFSKVLLLDMCPLMAFLIPLSLIFDKTKNFAKCIAPIGLVGSIITLYGGVIFDSDLKLIKWDEFYKYIFFGTENDSTMNRIYFMMHYMLLVISVHTLLNAKQYTRWSLLGSVIFYIIFIAYALILSRVLDITNNVTGLVEHDWLAPNGEYHVVYNMMPMSFPGIVIFWYFVAAIANLIICWVKNYLTNDLFKSSKYSRRWYEYKIFNCIEKYCRKIDSLKIPIIKSNFL